MHALNIFHAKISCANPFILKKENMLCVLKFIVKYSCLFYPPKTLGRYLALSIR